MEQTWLENEPCMWFETSNKSCHPSLFHSPWLYFSCTFNISLGKNIYTYVIVISKLVIALASASTKASIGIFNIYLPIRVVNFLTMFIVRNNYIFSAVRAFSQKFGVTQHTA